MSDNASATSLELLRFRPELTADSRFERALRDAVALLDTFKHPSFAQVRAVESLAGEERLALVSRHTPGKKLAELFQLPRRRGGMHPAFATWLIRELTPALADFHAHRAGVVHGALSADRIVLAPDGRFIIVEHVLGPALASRGLSADELWEDLGVIATPGFDGHPRLDARSDVVQLGLIALSVLLGRQVTPEEYPQSLSALLDEFSEHASRRAPALVPPLRRWLERALGTGDDRFESSLDASAAVRELPRPAVRQAFPQFQNQPPRTLASVPEPAMLDLALAGDIAPPSRGVFTARNFAIAFGALALLEAVVIARLMTASPAAATVAEIPVSIESPIAGSAVLVDGRPVGVTPMTVTVGAAVHAIRVVSEPAPVAPVSASQPGAGSRTSNAIAAAAARPRSGGLRLDSPVDLQVFEGDRVLGSSADGPIVAPPGEHQFDFVNTAIGFRSHQTVTIKAGQILPVTVTPPDGRVSVNAQPWAQVWIDGTQVGETPLANLAVPAGEHEITFRHPQLGERKQRLLVKSGVQTRVSATFR